MDITGIINTASTRADAMGDARRDAGIAELDRFRELLAAAIEETEEALNERRAQVRLAAEAFESYFIQIMFREMRRTTFDERGLFPRSNAERIFTDMLDEQIAISASSGRGIGLADMIYQQMTRDFM